MAADGLFAQNAHVVQAEHQALVVLGQAVVEIVNALGHVDVVAGALGLLGGAVFQRLVGEGEGRMHAHHALDHIGIILLRIADEIDVFLDRSAHLLRAVAVADLVAQVGAHAELLRALGQRKQASCDFAVAGVMVKDGRHAVFDAVQVGRVGAGF